MLLFPPNNFNYLFNLEILCLVYSYIFRIIIRYY
jgi:hypothetical protein